MVGEQAANRTAAAESKSPVRIPIKFRFPACNRPSFAAENRDRSLSGPALGRPDGRFPLESQFCQRDPTGRHPLVSVPPIRFVQAPRGADASAAPSCAGGRASAPARVLHGARRTRYAGRKIRVDRTPLLPCHAPPEG